MNSGLDKFLGDDDDPFADELSSGDLQRIDASEQVILDRLDAILTELPTLTDIKAVKELAKQAASIQYLVRKLHYNQDIRNAAAIAALWTRRRMGGLVPAPLPKGGDRKSISLSEIDNFSRVAEENGIPLSTAHQNYKLYTLPEPVFRQTIERLTKDEVTTAAVLKVIKQKELEEIKDALTNLAKAEGDTPAVVMKMDAETFLCTLAPASIDLLLTDPPYSTDVEDIEKFAHSWLPIALSRVKPTGRAYVCIGAYPEELLAYMTAPRAGMELSQILVWTYRNTLGPAPDYDYKLNWQAILYFKGKDAPPLNCGLPDDPEKSPLMNEQFSVQDINAPDGRRAERYHEWQKPDELAERFIRHSTKECDKVIDPFAGTGTFLAAAARLNRLALGCEPDEKMLDLCEKRRIEVKREG